MSDRGDVVGRRLAGRYDVLERLGTGGHAHVFRARDRRLDRAVAVKLFSDRSPNLRERFLREARSLARLNHPAIVTIYDACDEDDRLFVVMELVDGRPIAPGAPSAPRDVVRCVATVLDALSYAHEHDVLHRDLKPSNILVTSDGATKLTDFGLARRISDRGPGTPPGEIVGTIAYLPPERFLGKPSDVRSDLYSIGVVLYELLAGRPPFASDSDDLVAVIFAHLNERPQLPSELGADVEADLEAIVMRLLEKDPAARFPHARATAEALRATRVYGREH